MKKKLWKEKILSSIPEILILSIGLSSTGYLGLETFKYNKMRNSELKYNSQNYKIDDIYIVYNMDNIWFCERKIYNVNTKFEEKNKEIYGYRELVYGYYDIKSGEKICVDFDINFFIEPLLDACYKDKIIFNNNIIGLDSIEKKVTINRLLEREPEPLVLIKKK